MNPVLSLKSMPALTKGLGFRDGPCHLGFLCMILGPLGSKYILFGHMNP